MAKQAVIIGAGLGGLATALRLTTLGYQVRVLEQHHTPGGRLNVLRQDGFTFDVGPSFFSMSYEFTELFQAVGMQNPLQLIELDPLYAVNFAHHKQPFLIHKDPAKLAQTFGALESNFEAKLKRYLDAAQAIFHDTEYRIVKRNYRGLADYLAALATVPLKHTPKLLRNMWTELGRHFSSEEAKVVFSLVAFFLGATPFDTPSVYSLLNYTELRHDGYWCVGGGMYQIVEKIVQELERRGVQFSYNTQVVGYAEQAGRLQEVIDKQGNKWAADVFVCNADAAAFRGGVLQRKKWNEKKLDSMDWTLAPFTIYLGVRGKLNNVYHHNYYLGSNFTEYANTIFKTSVAPEQPYYYVNISSQTTPSCAPEGCENIFILCPVPDLRYKPDWADSQRLADTIIRDLGQRIGYDLAANTLTRTVYTPLDWQRMFGLYRGSGLGLAHGLNQVGGLRPNNKDEALNNLYYVGASTVPGTGLPMVVVSSKLVTERIAHEHTAI